MHTSQHNELRNITVPPALFAYANYLSLRFQVVNIPIRISIWYKPPKGQGWRKHLCHDLKVISL